jgi:hypothetical protein
MGTALHVLISLERPFSLQPVAQRLLDIQEIRHETFLTGVSQ